MRRCLEMVALLAAAGSAVTWAQIAMPGGWKMGDGALTPNLTSDVVDREATYALPGRLQERAWDVLRLDNFFSRGGWETAAVSAKQNGYYFVTFNRELMVGSVLMYGPGELSYLKPGGTPAVEDEPQWVSVKYGGDPGALLRLIPLPPATRTRALRVKTELGLLRSGADAGKFRSDLMLLTTFEKRFTNIAPQAEISVSSSGPLSTGFQPNPRLNKPQSLLDGRVESRNWSTGDRADPISPDKPEWIVLQWPSRQTARGLCIITGAFESGFGTMEIQRFAGPGAPPAGSSDAGWEMIKTVQNSRPWRPSFWECYADFGADISFTALRLKITEATPKERTAGGEGFDPKVVSFGEIMVFSDLHEAPPVMASAAADPQGVVGIQVELPQAGKVSLQILDAQGNVVENLVTGELPAGPNTIWWDGTTLDNFWPPFAPPKPETGELRGPPLAQPGHYRWRGLFNPGLQLHYRYAYYPFPVSTVAWVSADHRGGWLADHEPPRTVIRFGDRMWIGTFCEAGEALVEADLDMNKLWGSNRIWLACPTVLSTDGRSIFFVAKGGWVGDRMVIIQINPETKASRRLLVQDLEKGKQPDIRGFQVCGTKAFISFGNENVIRVYDLAQNLAGPWRGFGWAEVGGSIDAEKPKVVQEIQLPSPGDVRMFSQTELITTSQTDVVLVHKDTYAVRTLWADKVENPLSLAVDDDGNVYVGEGEPVHQVKCFSAKGELLRTYGKLGKRKVGSFDPDDLESPSGLAVDAMGRLWVAEHTHTPKRVSVWDANGHCVKAVYGPTQYGGGGCIDPGDANRMFYQGMEFRRDPQDGRIELTKILFRADDTRYDQFDSYPSYAFRRNGNVYFTSWQGWAKAGITALWRYYGDEVRPVAAVGTTPEWIARRIDPGVQDPRFGEKVLERVDESIEFNFSNLAPAPGVNQTDIAVRWTGRILIPRQGTYTFITRSDDGVRLTVDGKLIIDNWTNHAPTEDRGMIDLDAGSHDIMLEYFQGGGGAEIKLEWEGPEIGRQLVPKEVLRASTDPNAQQGLTGAYYHRSEVRGIGHLFAWTDGNNDGIVQGTEVRTGDLKLNDKTWERFGATWQCRMNENFEVAVTDASYGTAAVAFFRVRSTTPDGNPIYELPTEFRKLDGMTHAADAVMVDRTGNAIAMFEYLVSLTPDGKVNWRYKNRWPGLHAGHNTSAAGDEPGVLIAPTRFFGSAVVNDEVGEVISLNSNLGATYLMTSDGLFIDRVFQDTRVGLHWVMNEPPSEAVMNDMSLGDEHFGGTFQKVRDEQGNYHYYYVVGQPFCAVVELRGLESVKRLPGGEFELTAEQATRAQYLQQQKAAAERQVKEYTIRRAASVTIDGKDSEWPADRIDGFALAYDAANLYVLFSGKDDHAPFQNAATDDFTQVFKTGDVIDVMLQTRPGLDPKRLDAGEGDIRLSFAMVAGQPRAVLYDYVVPGIQGGVPFSSPWRTVRIARVELLEGARVAVARHGSTVCLEASVPLTEIHLEPAQLRETRGDVGRVLSDQTGTKSVARVYWSNKNTNIVSDLPSEARLQPNLWGILRFEGQ